MRSINKSRSINLHINPFFPIFKNFLHNMPPQRKRRQNRAVNKKVIDKKTVKRCHNSYSIKQKKQVITYAKENGIIKAAKFFELDKGMVSRWVNSNEKWVNEPN